MLMDLAIWQKLENHKKEFQGVSLSALFTADQNRAHIFSSELGSLKIDFSKNFITTETLQLLIELAEKRDLKKQILKLHSGDIVNQSEYQPASHLQSRITQTININPMFKKMEQLSDQIRDNEWKLHKGHIITDIIHLGTGGSYLGPHMSIESLSRFSDNQIHFHFIANQHDQVLKRKLSTLNPLTTLVILSSKSLGTSETLHNFHKVLAWLSKEMNTVEALQKQVIAITAFPEKALALGIPQDHILDFPTSIGGRYSIWSAVGLPLSIAIGFSGFREFIAGAELVDQHFINAPLAENIPVLLALIEMWYIHFFNANNMAVLPYHQDLSLLPSYLQQLSMESLGKSVSQENHSLAYSTGPVIWGGTGTTGQHAYHQLLHQGTVFIPCDFIVTYEDPFLFSQCLAQSHTLMMGQHEGEAFKRASGNRPSNTFVLPELTPYALGSLLALYEHKVFTQASVWGINPFDQWGVENGKELGQKLKHVVNYRELPMASDSSTCLLLEHYYQWVELNKKTEDRKIYEQIP